jgi:hypothetical protein
MMGVQDHSGNAGRTGAADRAVVRKRRAMTLAAVVLTGLLAGCVCRPVHVSGDEPTTTAELKAALPY